MQYLSSLKKASEKLQSQITPYASQLMQKAQEVQEQLAPQVKQLLDQIVIPYPLIIEIHPRIHYMPLPSQEKLQPTSEYVKEQFKNHYYIWNIGEYTYDKTLFDNKVKECNMVGYPCPTLNLIFSICKSILVFLQENPLNQAIINCQSSQGRSVLLISCLLCVMKVCSHPMEGVSMMAEKLKVSENSLLVASHKLYLSYFINVKNELKINLHKIKIKRIFINTIPIRDEKFRPYLQIFQHQKVVYNSLQKYENDSAVNFNVELEVDPEEDLLIRCKHYQDKQTRVPVFRILFNTGFIFDQVLRFNGKDVEMSPFYKVSDDFFIDFITEQMEESKNESSLQNIYKKLENSEQIQQCPNIQDILNQGLEKRNSQNFSLNEDEKEFEMKEIVKVEPPQNKQNQQKIQEIPKKVSEDIIEIKEKLKDDIETLQEDQEEIYQKITSHKKSEEEDDDLDDYFSKLENA